MSGQRDELAWSSLLRDVASTLASTETPERRIDRALALCTSSGIADRVAMRELAALTSREIIVAPPARRDEMERLRRRMDDLARLLIEVPPHRELGRIEDPREITLPLVAVGGVIGMLHAERREPSFDELDLNVLSGVAALLAAYLTVVRSLRDLAVAEENLRATYEAGLIGVAFIDANGRTVLNEAARRMMAIRPEEREPAGCDEALRRAEARFAGIIDLALDAIVVTDETWRVLLFNQGAERTFGYLRAEILGRPLDVLFPSRRRGELRAKFEDLARRREEARPVGAEADLVGMRKSGAELPIEAAVSSFELHGQRLLTMILRDVTERRRAEREQRILAEMTASLGSTLEREATLEGVAALGAQGLADCSVAVLLDEREAPCLLRAAVADPSRSALARAIERAPVGPGHTFPGRGVIRSRQPVLVRDLPPEYADVAVSSDEARAALRDLRPSSMMSVPLLARGRCVGALSLFSKRVPPYDERDLRVALAIALRAGLALDNAALHHATQEAVSARDAVLAIVAHDLRNPLSTIRIAVSLLRTDGLDPAAASRTLDAIERASGRAERLIEDLLDVHRIDEGTLSLVRRDVPARSLVTEAVESQAGLARASSLQLRAELPASSAHVRADRDRVLQVFENLIGNALKFTRAGGTITVSLEEARDEVVFRVRDTGAGLTPAEVAHAFDRSWDRPRRDRSGPGLGLMICQGIVRAHGGRIWVESAPGSGTTFSFSIPKLPNPSVSAGAR